MTEPKIGVICPFCQSDEVIITDIIAAFNLPHLPDIFAIDCKNCGRTGSGHREGKGWTIKWDEKT